MHTDNVAQWLKQFIIERSGEPNTSSPLQAQLSIRESEVLALQREIHVKACELAELRAQQESFKESERLLQRTHSDMVWCNMCGMVCKCVSESMKMLPQTALHQHCQALLQENHTLRQMAAENSAAERERGSGEDKRVTEMLLTQLITDTSKKVLPLVATSHFIYPYVCLLNKPGKKVFW